ARLPPGSAGRRRTQRSRAGAALGPRSGARLGSPAAPPASLAPASLEQVLEQAS
ncbi:oxidoreductase, partial [Pseudomonas aeruginosa]|nr:oxidoreductase [Pseudomonas aeruginosa]